MVPSPVPVPGIVSSHGNEGRRVAPGRTVQEKRTHCVIHHQTRLCQLHLAASARRRVTVLCLPLSQTQTAIWHFGQSHTLRVVRVTSSTPEPSVWTPPVLAAKFHQDRPSQNPSNPRVKHRRTRTWANAHIRVLRVPPTAVHSILTLQSHVCHGNYLRKRALGTEHDTTNPSRQSRTAANPRCYAVAMANQASKPPKGPANGMNPNQLPIVFHGLDPSPTPDPCTSVPHPCVPRQTDSTCEYSYSYCAAHAGKQPACQPKPEAAHPLPSLPPCPVFIQSGPPAATTVDRVTDVGSPHS